MSRFTFADDSHLSLAEVSATCAWEYQSDLDRYISAAKKALGSDGFDPAATPFTAEVVERLSKLLRATPGGEVLVAAFKRATAHLKLPRALWKQLSGDSARLERLLLASATGKSRYRLRDMRRLLIFISTCGLRSDAVTDEAIVEFEAALRYDPSIEHPDTHLDQAIRGWNWAVDTIRGWPRTRLTARKTREVWGYGWDVFPATFRAGCDASVRKRSRVAELLDPEGAPDLSESSRVTYLEFFRRWASHLVHAGVLPAAITHLRCLWEPHNLRLIAEGIESRAGGDPTEYTDLQFRVLRSRICAEALLTDEERAMALAIIGVEPQAGQRSRGTRSPDGKAARLVKLHSKRLADVLKEDDIEAFIRTVLRRPYEVAVRLRQQRLTRKIARKFKCTVILALGCEVPLGPSLLSLLQFADHFHREVDRQGRAILRLKIGRDEIWKGVERDHPLTPELSDLIREYMDVYRPRLDLSSSRYFLPGSSGQPIGQNTICDQMNGYFIEELGRDWSSGHLKALFKVLVLSEQPKATEGLRAAFGYAIDELALAAAAQLEARRQQQKQNDTLDRAASREQLK